MDKKRGGIHRNGVPLNFCLYLYPYSGQKIVTVVTFFAKSLKKSAPGRKSAPLRLFLFFQQFFKLIELAQFDFMA